MKSSVVVLLVSASFAFAVRQPLFCNTWTKIQDELHNQADTVNCNKTDSCNGIDCSLKKFGYDVQGGIQIFPCENPPSVEFRLNIPKLHIDSWKQRFYREESFALVGNDNLDGHFNLKVNHSTLILGLSIHIHNSSSSLIHAFSPILPSSQKMEFVILRDAEFEFQCPSISNSSSTTPTFMTPFLNFNGGSTNCSIQNTTCPLDEQCQQLNKTSPVGKCVCVPHYVRDHNGKCILVPTEPSFTDSPHDVPENPKTTGMSLILTAILVPITVIAAFVAASYAAVRFRVWQRLKRRLTVRVYEHVSLGQDSDLDDEMTNPVA